MPTTTPTTPSADTAAFLTRAEADDNPGDELLPGVRAFNRIAGRRAERATQLARLLRDAELSEDQPHVRALFPEMHEKLNAMQRVSAEIGERLRQLAQIEREFAAQRQRIRAMAEADPSAPVLVPAPVPGT